MAAADLMLCSRDDVIAMGFGGDVSEAIKLTRSDPQAWQASLLDTPIKMASADVEVAAGNRFALGPPPVGVGPEVYPFPLRKTTALRAVYYCWLTYCRGQAMPDGVKAAWDTTESDLARLRDSKQGPGTVKPPSSRIAGTAQIDLTDGGAFPRMTLDGWRGL